MPRGGRRVLLDAELLVKLAYLTITGQSDLKNLETLRLNHKQSGGNASPEGFGENLELTPLEELEKFCEDFLGESLSSMSDE
ncbi:MAG: hypothetical protein ACUVQ0_04950 [Thermoproteota archaeon]